MPEHIKITLAFGVSILAMTIAVGRWQGGVDASIAGLYEKATSFRDQMRDLNTKVDSIEAKLHEHLEKSDGK